MNRTEKARYVRLLLILCELGATGELIKRGDISTKAPKTGEKWQKDYEQTFKKILDSEAIAETTQGRSTLYQPRLESLKGLLKKELQDPNFSFDEILSAGRANVLVDLLRQAPVAVVSNGKATGGAMIASYEEFKTEASQLFERLNKGFNYSGLVPIWHLRREMGDRVDRVEFNEWLMKMQADQMFYLQSGEAIRATDDQKRDSLESEIRGLLFYVSYPLN
jgi:hypothetical protein